MNIVITGTTGFIGRSLADHFKANWDTVIEWHRNDMFPPAFVNQHKPDVIINCAGEIYNANAMYETNVGIVHNWLEGIKQYSPSTRFINIGSSAEYGPMPRASSEVDPINPIDVYQATKGAATLLCQGYARQFGLDTCVARIYSGYGVHERPHRLYPKLYEAFFNNVPMTLRDGYHDFIYIEDFVRGIELLLNSPWPKGEIVNFGSGVQHSNLEVLKTWERITGHKGAVNYEDGLSKAYESKVWICDPTYAKMQYKFFTHYTLEDGIRDFIEKKKQC
jgi:nucleoside-diphosphate-sugar epimerase